MLKRYVHNPPHLFLDESPYFITGAIYLKRPLLAAPELKQLVIEAFYTYFTQHQWELHQWVVLDNHYHVLGRSHNGKDLTPLVKGIHGSTAAEIRRATGCEKPVWWNFWDYCPRDQTDYLIRQNYLLNNPVKHGYVQDLHDYPYSTFQALVQDVGIEQLREQFKKYPQYKTLIITEALDDDF